MSTTSNFLCIHFSDRAAKHIEPTLAIVRYDGFVIWMPQIIMVAICSAEVSRFPHDTHICRLKVGQLQLKMKLQCNSAVKVNAANLECNFVLI